MRKIKSLPAVLVAAMALSIGGAALPAGAVAASPASSVTVIHGIVGVPVDVYVDDSLFLPGFEPTQQAGPVGLPAATYEIELFAAAANPPAEAPDAGAVLTQDVTVPGGASVSLVAHATDAGAPVLTAFANDVSAIDATSARVSVRHTANAPAVDVSLDGTTAISGLSNPLSADADIPAGTYDVAVAPSAGGPPVIGPAALEFLAGQVTAVYAISALDGSDIQPLVQSIPLSSGYRFAASDGGVFSYGTDGFFGSLGAITLNQPIVDGAALDDSTGYLLAAADGGVFAFGDLPFLGSGVGAATAPIVGVALTPTGLGYWLVQDDGKVWAFGDADDSLGGLDDVTLSAPVVDIVGTSTGAGYLIVTADGGVFAFGDAPFLGSGVGAATAPAVGVALTPTGLGYWLVQDDGKVWAFGDADADLGDASSLSLNQPVVAVEATAAGQGYTLVAADGGVFSYGNAGFFGSTGDIALNQPIVAVL